MKTKLKHLIALILLFQTLLFTSCKEKNTSVDFNPAITASQEFVANQQMMTQLLNTYFKSLNDSLLWATGQAEIDGANVTIKSWPEYMMEIYYPWWGKDDGYDHYRMGVIEAIPNDDFTSSNLIVDLVFNDFLYDKDTLEVQKMTVQHMETEPGEDKKYVVTVDSAVVIYQDTSGQLSFNMDQVFKLKKDHSSVYYTMLDELKITGSMDGITINLDTYSAEIADSSYLIKLFDCPWLKHGSPELTVVDFPYISVINYPQPDTCQNEYVIDIDGNPFPYPFDFYWK